MKLFRIMLSLAVLLACMVVALGATLKAGPLYGAAAGALSLFILGNAIARPSARLCATLTATEIATDVLDAFKTQLPVVSMFAMDMKAEGVMKGQTVIAHLPIVPTANDHDTTNGYLANAQAANSLLADVPIVIDQWKDVAIKIPHTDAVTDRSKNYLETVNNAGYALTKVVVDYACGKFLAANFSQSTVQAVADNSYQTLSAIRGKMNVKKAGSTRFGLVNSDVFNALDNDSQVSSKEYSGQQLGASPYGRLVNIAGFREIIEYPDLPANGENLSGFFFDTRAIGIATRLPLDSTELARTLGIPVNFKVEVVQDEQTGLSLMALWWLDGNLQINMVYTIMFGVVAGKQGGSGGAKTDYAGHRLVTA